MKVDLSCPIELWEYDLPTAENPVISFTFFNLGERTISSIQVTVTCFDEADSVLSRRVERPMALNARGREPFSVYLDSEGMPVESLDLTIDKVWYEDGSEWRRQQDVRLVEYEPNELPPNRKLEELQYVAGQDAVGFPSEQGHVWICVCGRVNAQEERRCRRCDRDKDEVFDLYTPEAVQDAIDAREQELEERARMAREEASRLEFMRQDRARRKKRARRTRTIVISVVLVVGVLTYLFVVLGLPELRYQSALAAMREGNYAIAREGFDALGEYRDAADMVYQSDIQQADEYIQSGDIDKIDVAIGLLEGLGDYPGATEKIDEAVYHKGLRYLDDAAYAKASETLALIPDYADAQTLRKEAEYSLAKQEMQAGEYEAASGRFAALGNYLDAAAMANECVYLPAKALMDRGEYAQAAEMFGTIVGYRDASDQRLDALYKDAMQAQVAGEYEYAAERFTLLGDYEDAPEQVIHSIYLAAGTARDAGNYEIARTLYATIPGYQDADEQIKVCTYMPAKELMSAGAYEEAAALLAEIPGYLDADDLYNQSIYLPAQAAAESGDYDEALRLYALIPDYSDVPKLRNQAAYRQAEQMEAEGLTEAAADAFAALGDYSDAADRARQARYTLAEEAYEAGEYAQAAQQFAALGRYSDAPTRVKACEYALAMGLFEEEDYAQAYAAFADIDDYAPATEKMRESAYRLGEALEAAGDLEGAAEAFSNAGRYEDASERAQDSIYQLATQYMDAGDYQQASGLFDSIRTYTDAKEKRDECYDLWLSEKTEQATAMYDAEDFQGVVDLLKDLDMTSLPKAYEDMQTMYLDANIRIARDLIAQDRSLEAYGYLMASAGYRNADTLLDKNIYRLLGTWTTEGGDVYAFYLNGVANLNGQTVYYNMVTNNPYGIFIGTTNDPEEMERSYSYVSATEKTLRIRNEETEKVISLTRVKGPEVSATNDSSGMLMMPEDQLEAQEPVVDVIEIDGAAAGGEPIADMPREDEEEDDTAPPAATEPPEDEDVYG